MTRRRQGEEQKGLPNLETARRARNGWPRAAQESQDGSGRESASDDASAGCPVTETGSRPASDLPRSLGQGTNSPGAVSQLRAAQRDHHLSSWPGVSLRSGTARVREHSPPPRCPYLGPSTQHEVGNDGDRSQRDSGPGPRAPRVAGPPLPIIPQAMKCRGMASLVLCSLTKWKGSFLQAQTEKETKVAVSPAGRTQDIRLSKGMCIAVAKKSIVFLTAETRGKEAEHGHSFHPRELSSALPARTPLHPRVPRWGTEGAREGGWGPGSVTTHLRPPRSSPRAAAAARSSPWPGGAGRSRARRVREGAEPSRPRDEAPTALGRNRGSLSLPPAGAPGSVSGRQRLGAAGRGCAGRWGDPRAPAWRGPGTSGAAGAPGP